MSFLYDMGVLLKDFGEYVQKTSAQLKEASCEIAERRERSNIYLESSKTNKEQLAKKIMDKDKLTAGLICLLRCVEPCISYKTGWDNDSKNLILEAKPRKCLYIYHYWIDPDAQSRYSHFMSARIRVPGMAYLLIFRTSSGSKTPAVTGRKGNTNKARASSEMAGLEEA